MQFLWIDSAGDDANRIGNLKGEVRALLQKCKALVRSTKVSRPSRCFAYPGVPLSRPTRQVADVLANLYFSKLESSFRIIHIPSFWVEYEEYWRTPSAASIATQLKVQLILVLGSAFSRDQSNGAAHRAMASQAVCVAQSWLAGPLEKDRLTIAGLQVHCLLILAR